jgi:dihydroorotate dehydrogenase
MPLIGVGGISCPETAAEKIRAGADLVQLYTSMVYGGPALPGQIVRGLSDLCDREGLSHLSQIRDTRMEDWANRAI